MIVVRLQDGKHGEALTLLRQWPAFDPAELGLRRHSAYLTMRELVFVFEARDVERIVSDVVNDPVLSTALGPWYSLVEGPARLAHESYHWVCDEVRTSFRGAKAPTAP